MMRTAVPLLATVILACAIAVAHGQQDDNAGPWQTYDTSNGECRSYAGDIAGGIVKLTKTRLADPQDDGLESCCEPGMLGVGHPDSA